MKKLIILVADDEPHVTSMLSYKLGQMGVEIISAGDGAEALQLARENKPDLVITDFQMPEMNGLELATQLRSLQETSTVPVIMLTARGHMLTEEQLTRLNIRMVIPKPFSPRALINEVTKLMRETGNFEIDTQSDTTRGEAA